MVVMGVRVDDVGPIGAVQRLLDLLLDRGHTSRRGLRIDDDQALLGLDHREVAPAVDARPVGQSDAWREPVDADVWTRVGLRTGREQLHEQAEMNRRNHFRSPLTANIMRHGDSDHAVVPLYQCDNRDCFTPGKIVGRMIIRPYGGKFNAA